MLIYKVHTLDILALSESKVFNSLGQNQYNYTEYNFEPVFFPHRVIGVYVRDTVCTVHCTDAIFFLSIITALRIYDSKLIKPYARVILLYLTLNRIA